MKASIIAAALLFAAPAWAAPTAEQVTTARQTLHGWFAGYEFVPDQSHYKKLGEALPYALHAIAVDEQADLLERARAVSAMLYATTPEIELLLVRMVENDGYPSLLRRKGLLVLAEGWGVKHAPLVYNVWAASPQDLRLREACARAFKAMGPAADHLRDGLLRLEKAPTVRAILNEEKQIGVTP